MNFNSIRWRLPFSYAAIALLAALVLGSVMLLVLDRYYTGLERNYLEGNARALRPIVERALQTDSPVQTLQDQITGLAFISQTQIRVLDGAGRPIADSGVPDTRQMVAVSGASSGVTFNVAVDPAYAAKGPVIIFSRNVQTTPFPMTVPLDKDIPVDKTILPPPADAFIPVSASWFGYGFAEPVAIPDRRSSEVVSQPLQDALGTLEMSNGPAYGADILQAVTFAWLVAGIVAIVLAALAGWFASRQVTRPVLALTEATRQMEQGRLSARVELDNEKQQEFTALADSFNNMAQRVEDTVATLRAFVSDAAHELNTPLTALQTNLELAANEPDAAQKGIFLARALEQNRRLELLTGGLLDLSRIEAISSAPDFGMVDFRQLVAESAERFASRAEQAERSFSLDLPTGELTLYGNAPQLQRVVENLLENALKFTPPGGAIRLRVEYGEEQVVLTVSDTGIGILPEDLPDLFKRFHRGRNSAEFPGNGLGLAIVKAIVDAHAGQVKVESAGREKGSTFSISFPGTLAFVK